jgi:hypothetical protein
MTGASATAQTELGERIDRRRGKAAARMSAPALEAGELRGRRPKPN